MFNSHIRKMASEKLVAVDLLTKGFMVLEPITDIVENYDLAVEINGQLKKVQVKSAREDEKGRMIVDVRRSSRAKTRHYEDDAYDIIAIVNLERRLVAYMKKEEMTAKNTINIWCCEPEEVPTKGRHAGYKPLMFNDFLEVPVR